MKIRHCLSVSIDELKIAFLNILSYVLMNESYAATSHSSWKLHLACYTIDSSVHHHGFDMRQLTRQFGIDETLKAIEEQGPCVWECWDFTAIGFRVSTDQQSITKYTLISSLCGSIC